MKLLQLLGLGALALNFASAHYLTDEEIMEEFTPYDLDKDNFISTKEMEAATRQQLKQFEDPYVAAEEMNNFINDIVKGLMENDADKDGKLNFDEFASMMRKEHSHGGHSHGEEPAQESSGDVEVVNENAEEEIKAVEL